MNNRNKIFKFRSLVFTVAFILILLLVNIVIDKVIDTYPLKIDVTADERFTLSEESKKILGNLEKDVYIYLIESDRYPMDRDVAEIIDRYRKYSNDRIVVESKDIVTDYAFAAKYSGNIAYGYLVFECGEVSKLEYAGDLLNDSDMIYTVENTITNDIVYVSSDANSLVYTTIGHGEDDFGSITTALNSENYTFKSINLLKEDIPGNVALMTIYGPKKDFDPTEIAKMNQFLESGGNIQIYLDPSTTNLKNLYNFTDSWGIGITDNYIVEKDADRLDVQGRDLMHPNITDYAFAQDIFTENDTIVLSNVHALTYDGDNAKGAQNVVAMLYSSQNAASRAISNSSTASEGEQYMAILSTKIESETESNLFVVGTTDLFNNAYFAEGSIYSNRDFYLKSIGWMCGFKDSIKISTKRVHSDILGLSQSDGIQYTVIIFAVAIIVLIFGIIVWARRRYL